MSNFIGVRNGYLCNHRGLGGGVAYLYRLIFSFVLALLSGSAFAVIYPVPAPAEVQCSLISPRGDTCRAYVAVNLYGPGGSCTVRFHAASSSCYVDLHTPTYPNVLDTEGWSVTPLPDTCPADSVPSGAVCVCSAGFVEVGSACVPDTNSPGGSHSDPCHEFANEKDWVTVAGKNPLKSQKCIGDVGGESGPSCTAQFSPGVMMKDKVSGEWTTQGEVIYSGVKCVPAPSDNAAPEPCKGQAGSVNGVAVCLPYPPDATKVANGSTTTKPVDPATGEGSGDGVTTEKNTQCTGDKCTTTTTTTTTTAGGEPPVVSTEQKEQDKQSFCTENPTATVCKESAFSGGGCGAPDSCSGDAVLCAIQAQAKETKCALTTAPTGPLVDAYSAAAARSLQDETAALAGNPTVNISPGSFDQTELLGAAGGMQDLNVTIMGSSIVMPFSVVNVWLERLGIILQAVTFLLCVRIVSRG